MVADGKVLKKRHADVFETFKQSENHEGRLNKSQLVYSLVPDNKNAKDKKDKKVCC